MLSRSEVVFHDNFQLCTAVQTQELNVSFIWKQDLQSRLGAMRLLFVPVLKMFLAIQCYDDDVKRTMQYWLSSQISTIL